MRKRVFLTLLCAFFAASAFPACADTFAVFAFSNTVFPNGSSVPLAGPDPVTVNGTITVDETLGTITDSNFTVGNIPFMGPGIAYVTSIVSGRAVYSGYGFLYLIPLQPLNQISFDFAIPGVFNLKGYTGGVLCTAMTGDCEDGNTELAYPRYGPHVYASSGSLVEISGPSAVPEPSSILMVGSGLAVVLARFKAGTRSRLRRNE